MTDRAVSPPLLDVARNPATTGELIQPDEAVTPPSSSQPLTSCWRRPAGPKVVGSESAIRAVSSRDPTRPTRRRPADTTVSIDCPLTQAPVHHRLPRGGRQPLGFLR